MTTTSQGKALPSWRDLSERGAVTAMLILASVLFISIIAAPSTIADSTASGIATAGLIIASAVGGWCYAGPNDRSSAIGVGVGMPLGFFFFQNSYARNAGIIDLAAGSSKIMSISAAVAIAAGISAWIYRRHLKGHK